MEKSRPVNPRKGVPIAPAPPHGTRAGYARHTRYGEPPCDACRAANSTRSKLVYDAARAKRKS